MKSILVVDDSAFMRQVLKKIIKETFPATEFIEAGDGVDAVQKYIQHKPDIVTLDIRMPKADGFQALRAIRKSNPLANVVMASYVHEKEVINDALKLGAKDYIEKPFKKEKIQTALSNLGCF